MFYDLNQQRARARNLRKQLRELLDDADAGRMCLLQNAEQIAVIAKELREVENSIDDRLFVAAGE